MAQAIIYSLAVILAASVIFTSKLKQVAKYGCIVAVVVFAAVLYLYSSSSAISPFSRGPTSFGFLDNTVQLLVGFVGTLAGTVISILGTGSRSDLGKRLLKPLMVAPVILIPTLELVQESSEATLVAFLLLFAVSYQNGYFWQRILDEG